MSLCDLGRPFVERELSDAEERAFAAHLETCQTCRTEIEGYHASQAMAREWLEGRVQLDVEPQRARALWQRARAQPLPEHRSRMPWLLGAGVAVPAIAVVLAVLWLTFGKQPSSVPTLVVHQVGGVSEHSGEAITGTELETRRDRLVAELGGDRIGLAHQSKATVVDATPTHRRFRLHSGRLVVAAKKRSRGEFVVEAAQLEIHVVGTLFSVTHTEERWLEVAVSEGTVRVSGLRALELVHGGEILTIDHHQNVERASLDHRARQELEILLTRPRPAPPSTESEVEAEVKGKKSKARKKKRQSAYDDWLQWVSDGAYDKAERTIREHLRKHKDDTPARMLLADCLRKAGKHEQAADLYQRLTKDGDSVVNNRARLLAAEIYQKHLGDHHAAIRLLRTYLGQPRQARPLEAGAMLRLARSLRAVGEEGEATRLLNEIVRRHPTSSAVGEAKALLNDER